MALLRHLALRCRDMETSRKFYETGFGWEFLGYRPSGRGCDLTDGACNITLLQQPQDCTRPTLEEGNEYIHFGVIVADVAACRGRLERLGAEIAAEAIKHDLPADERLAGISFKALDPDGNIIDVTSNRTEWLGVSGLPGCSLTAARADEPSMPPEAGTGSSPLFQDR